MVPQNVSAHPLTSSPLASDQMTSSNQENTPTTRTKQNANAPGFTLQQTGECATADEIVSSSKNELFLLPASAVEVMESEPCVRVSVCLLCTLLPKSFDL